MATYVLVHGGWTGGSVWHTVTSLLRAAGHDVFAPTLTGMRERTHLLSPAVGLDTHITDVVNLLTYDDLIDVILVGHSYAGMVISGVAAQAGARLAHLIYLDAFLPDAGQCLFDLQPQLRDRLLATAAAQGDGWRIPAPPPERAGLSDEPDRSWFAAHATPSRCSPSSKRSGWRPPARPCLPAYNRPSRRAILCRREGHSALPSLRIALSFFRRVRPSVLPWMGSSSADAAEYAAHRRALMAVTPYCVVPPDHPATGRLLGVPFA